MSLEPLSRAYGLRFWVEVIWRATAIFNILLEASDPRWLFMLDAPY